MTFTHHEQTPHPEHPFAEIIRILGKGKKGSRPLTQNEAYHAMNMILTDQVLPIQLGAFLMLMRFTVICLIWSLMLRCLRITERLRNSYISAFAFFFIAVA